MFNLKSISNLLNLGSKFFLMLLLITPATSHAINHDDDIISDLICNANPYTLFCRWSQSSGVFREDSMLINDIRYKVVQTKEVMTIRDDAGNFTHIRPNVRQTKNGLEIEYNVETNETTENFVYPMHDTPSKDATLFAREIEEEMIDYFVRISFRGNDPGLFGPKFNQCLLDNLSLMWYIPVTVCLIHHGHWAED